MVAGPVEATALGNIAMQLVATGAAATVADARAIVAASFPLHEFQPRRHTSWDGPYARFRDAVGIVAQS